MTKVDIKQDSAGWPPGYQIRVQSAGGSITKIHSDLTFNLFADMGNIFSVQTKSSRNFFSIKPPKNPSLDFPVKVEKPEIKIDLVFGVVLYSDWLKVRRLENGMMTAGLAVSRKITRRSGDPAKIICLGQTFIILNKLSPTLP